MRALLAGLLLLAACGESPTLVVVNGLAPGDGGSGTTAAAHFDVVVRMEADCTDFHTRDLMRLFVDGVDRTDEVVMGGRFALLRTDPPPLGTRFVEVYRRLGPVLDTFTWDVQPYAGPTLAGVAPDSAREGTQVAIAGTGFAAGPLRVFFGGVEGTVDGSTDSTITATVPAGALPGPLWVLVGADAAEGLVGFQPLDLADQPVPAPTDLRLFAAFPARGPEETAVLVYGADFDDDAYPVFNDKNSTRVFDVQTVVLPPVGTVLRAYAVVYRDTEPGASTMRLREDDRRSNDLPFTVDG
jgi:hypothetical protein